MRRLSFGIVSAFVFALSRGDAVEKPELLFVADGKVVPLTAAARAEIVSEIEAVEKSITETSDRAPENFRGTFFSISPRQIEENGNYLRLIYSIPVLLDTKAGTIAVKQFYVGINPNGMLPGYPGTCFVTPEGRSVHATAADPALEELGLNPAIFPSLPSEIRWRVEDEVDGIAVQGAKEDLGPRLRLVRAAMDGDLAETKTLLAQGIDPDHLPGKTTLLFAAGSPEVAEFLLQQGIAVDARNDSGYTALLWICKNDSARRPQDVIAPTARVLLKHGANPNAPTDGSWWTPLMVARDGATVDALVDAGADVRAKVQGHGLLDELDIGWRTLPYYQAVATHGLPIDNQENGIHLLVHASYSGQVEIVQWLLDRGIDPNGTDPLGGFIDGFPPKPLVEAAQLDQAEVAKLLVAHGAKIDDDVMNCAIRNDRTRVLKVFWESGARNFSELLYDVIQGAPIETLELLLKQGMPADPPQDKHMTPLARAAEHGNLPVVKLLVEHGADPNRKLEEFAGDHQFDFAPWTPLALAAGRGQSEVVAYLLQNGAHPDADTLRLTLYCFNHRGQRAPSDDTFHQILQSFVDAGACRNVARDQMAGLLLWTGEGSGDWYDLPTLEILLKAGLDPVAKNAKGQSATELVQARLDKVKDAQRRAHFREVLALFAKMSR